MKKIDLVICAETGWSSFGVDYFSPQCSRFFTMSNFDASKTYDKHTTLFVVSLDYNHNVLQYISEGYKFIIDALWEARPYTKNTLVYREYEHGCSITSSTNTTPSIGTQISVPNWFWYNECMVYTAAGYQDYVPVKTLEKLFLMPMNRKKDHRDALLSRLGGLLDQSLYSYVADGKLLPGSEIGEVRSTMGGRAFNPMWYDQTYFSVVAETYIESKGFDIFITEKTFKCIAHCHPFLVYGTTGTLAHLQSQGFETYSNIFNESYDSQCDPQKRLEDIYYNVAQFDVDAYHSILTAQKLEHNVNQFYDIEQVKYRCVKEIFEPIIEYFETK